VPLSRSLSRDSSKSSGSNISTLDLGGLNVNELASLPQDSPFDWHVHFFPPLRNISEDLNILRLLSQSLANPFRITRPETARVTDGVEEVHHALSEVCLRVRADRISYAHHIINTSWSPDDILRYVR
jgi:hypothetical protein